MARNKAMIPLMGMSVLMFVSLFFSSKIAAVGLSVLVIIVGWTTYKTIFLNATIGWT